MRNTVFKQLKSTIKAKGISQSHISRATGIKRYTMYDILSGRRDIKMDELFAICAAIGEKPSTFMDDPQKEEG